MNDTTTHSKIKTTASTTYVGLYPQNKTITAPSIQRILPARAVKHLRQRVSQINTRLLIHVAFALAALAIVSYSSTANTGAAVMANGNSGSSFDVASASSDTTATLAAGAIIARSTNSLIQTDVEKKANDATAQVALATANDDFLTKQQPPITAGSPTRDISTYTVAGGDTLSAIAEKFSITSNTIVWANNLSDDATIKPGQQLTILPVSGVLYTTSGGDTATSIASKFQANADLIESYNSLSGDPLNAGTKLIVPDGVIPAAPKPAPAQPTILTNTFSNAHINFRGGSNSYAFGYCTWYVANQRYIPDDMGNANQWPSSARAAGMNVSSSPVAGAAGVVRWGNHVVYIQSVSGNTVNYSEMNGPAGWDRVDYGSAPASNFIYIY